MRKLIVLTLLTAFLTASVAAQKQLKPWGEWSEKEAQKILDDSPWGITQTESDISEMFFQPTSQGGPNASTRLRQGATNSEVHINYRIRFFTAKPIRQALVRLIELNQSKLSGDTRDSLTQFANLRSDNLIIVTVGFDSSDQRFSGPVMQAFGSATTEALKNNTYLECSNGMKVFLSEYVPPGRDGFGARFIFPRQVNGAQFLTGDSREVRFYTEFPTVTDPNNKPVTPAASANVKNSVSAPLSNAIKLDRRFKIADMMYDGHLEF
jgi:hypothetical protein